MLSSLTRHFNESVFRGPPDEGSGGAPEDGDTGTLGGEDLGGEGGDDGGGEDPDRTLTVREQIKKSIAETSEQPEPKKKPRDKSGRFGDRRAAGQEAEPQEVEEPEAPAVTIPAPDSLSKEAKADWDKAPETVKQAFIKREQDTAAGVEQLRQRYAQIDQAIAPHNDALRQMNATPADAVNRMFLWFKALAGKPVEAFPALAQSMGLDWKQLVGPQQAGTPDPAAAASGAPEIPEPIKNYVGQLEQRLQQLTQYVQQVGGQYGNIEQNINNQNEARTRENLNLWSNGKEFFEEVRADMAKLIETGVVPLKNGQVDLDTAYERAIYFNPEVRAKVLAKQQQANTQVQQQNTDAATTARQSQVNRAKKASVSLPASTTPGTGNGVPATKKKPGEKLSVRDSLKAAMAELRDQ